MNSKYEIIIYWNETDACFIAQVPDLPGCLADGGTYTCAMSNAQQIIDEWTETAQLMNRPVPAPKGRLMFA